MNEVKLIDLQEFKLPAWLPQPYVEALADAIEKTSFAPPILVLDDELLSPDVVAAPLLFLPEFPESLHGIPSKKFKLIENDATAQADSAARVLAEMFRQTAGLVAALQSRGIDVAEVLKTGSFSFGARGPKDNQQ